MELTRDDEINTFYVIISDSEDASARFDQKEAARQLKGWLEQEILMQSPY
jgi:hypothetical protein